MRVKKRSSGFLCLVSICYLLISGCNYSTEYQVINTANKFSVSIPPWMKKVDDLKPGAEFQYANRFRNFYVIGNIEEQRPVSAVMNFNLNVLRKSLTNPVVTDSLAANINGLAGIRCEIYGKMNNENIYFSELLLQGKNNLYHLSIWTRGEDRKLRYKEEIERIFHSFREI